MKKLAISAAIALAVLSGACACDFTSSGSDVEVEDCDAEDYRNRESDCGFTDADRKKTPAVRKPAPKNTKR